MLGRLTTVLVVAMLSLSAAAPSVQEPLTVRAAVEAYQAGEWRRALEALDSWEGTAARLTKELGAWIRAASGTSERQRDVVAAAFALDAVWTATRHGASTRWQLPLGSTPGGGTSALRSHSSQGFLATWAVRQLPAAGPVTATERALWLAAIGIAEDASDWRGMLTDILPLARKRLPDDSRVRLAAVVAQTSSDVRSLRFRTGYGRPNFSVLREEGLLSRMTKPIPAAITRLETLLNDASLAGEVELRIGYLELRRRNWPAALGRFDAARARTADPVLLATADYFAGWVHEQLDQQDEAIAAYRRAIAITPTMRNLATRLSALLFLHDERTEAYAVLDRALNARPVTLDLLVSLERGDGRFVDEWLSTVRRGLKATGGF
jgi:tetratricopeptide (TPR) repeat protein